MSICRENVDKRLNIAFLQENAVRAVSMGEGRLDQQQVFPELPSHDEADDDDEEDAAAAAADDDDDDAAAAADAADADDDDAFSFFCLRMTIASQNQ